MSINTIVMIWSHSNTVFSNSNTFFIIQINGVIPKPSLVFKSMFERKHISIAIKAGPVQL